MMQEEKKVYIRWDRNLLELENMGIAEVSR